MNTKTLLLNRRASYEYSIISTIECGVMLRGWEVAGVKSGHMSIETAYVSVDGNKLILKGSSIEPHQRRAIQVEPNSTRELTISRDRVLLANKKEIKEIADHCQQNGNTAIINSIITNEKGLIKCLVSLVKGKNKHDKREAIKDREWKRDKQRIERG